MFFTNEQYFQRACEIVHTAGEIIRAAQSKKQQIVIESKGKNDIVTNVDVLVENHIVQALKASFPHHKILAEESGLSGDLNSDYLWILDPIDGTKNFARHNPYCCISLALQCKMGDNFETVVGIVYQTALDYLFTAIKGQGAYLNNIAINVSAVPDLAQAVICVGYGYDCINHHPYRNQNIKFLTTMSTFRLMGARALDLAYVAAGIFDGLFVMHTAKIWDIAAGILIVQEAGGVIINPLTGLAHHDGPFIAGHPHITQQLFHCYHQPLKQSQ